MVKTADFSTEYLVAEPDDYLKVSKTGETKDKGIKYSDFLNQLNKTNNSNVIIPDYLINNNGGLELNNGNNTILPKMINNLTYFINFKNIPYNWQYKANPTCNLFYMYEYPLINGYFYDTYGYKELDANTIGNGLHKIVFDINLQSWKLYKLGRSSSKIFAILVDEDIAGAINITNNLTITEENNPILYKYFPKNTVFENCCMAFLFDNYTKLGLNYGTISVNATSSVGGFTYTFRNDAIDMEGKPINDNLIGFGSMVTKKLSTEINAAADDVNPDHASRIEYGRINLSSPSIDTNMPAGDFYNDLDVMSKRLGVKFMIEL